MSAEKRMSQSLAENWLVALAAAVSKFVCVAGMTIVFLLLFVYGQAFVEAVERGWVR